MTMPVSLHPLAFTLAFRVMLPVADAQPLEVKHNRAAVADRANYVAKAIDQAVNPSKLPIGFKGMIVGYLDDFGPVYKTYGIATVDGAVALNERTLFGIGSATNSSPPRCSQLRMGRVLRLRHQFFPFFRRKF